MASPFKKRDSLLLDVDRGLFALAFSRLLEQLHQPLEIDLEVGGDGICLDESAFDVAFAVHRVPIFVGYIGIPSTLRRCSSASSENSGGRSLMTTRIVRASKVL